MEEKLAESPANLLFVEALPPGVAAVVRARLVVGDGAIGMFVILPAGGLERMRVVVLERTVQPLERVQIEADGRRPVATADGRGMGRVEDRARSGWRCARPSGVERRR